ncbi:SpoIIE family protein phosphatase [Candidatus Poribacteria bacterium]|nr:SpoIIE family protein phosphatase [Candidatus Poribacteria bacterium]
MTALLSALYFFVLAGLVGFMVRLKKRVWWQNYQIQKSEREQQTVFRFLNEIGERITKRVDLEETLELVVAFCMNATKADAGAIFLKDDDDGETLQARVVQGLFPPLHEVSTVKLISRRKYLVEYVKKEKLRVGEGIIGFVAKTGDPILIPDASLDPRVPKSASEFVPLEGLILAPLVVRGSVLGVLVLINKREEGVTFTEADRDLVTALADQAAVTLDIVRLYAVLAEKQRLEQELRVAHEFQALLLPRDMPDLPELEIYGYSTPALEVGGDYFDFIEVAPRHFGVVVADVAGKGIPGALVMATLRATLRAEAHGAPSPREVLLRVNDRTVRDTKENIFITISYGIIDLDRGTLRGVRAGHEPFICCPQNGSDLQSYAPNGMVLGLIPGEPFGILEEVEIDLKSAGTVVLYTDGVPEAMNEAKEEYGEARFHQVLRQCHHESPETVINTVMKDIGEFTGGIPQHDDITLVVLRWRSKDSG